MPLGKKEPAEQIAPLCCSTPLPPQTCSRGKTVVFLLNRACALRSRFPNCVSIVSLEHLLRYCARPPIAFQRLSNRPATGRHHRHDQLGRVLAGHVHQTGMAQRDSSKECPECRLRVRPRGRSQHIHRRKPRPQNQHAKLTRAKSPPSNFDRVAFSAETGAKKALHRGQVMMLCCRSLPAQSKSHARITSPVSRVGH